MVTKLSRPFIDIDAAVADSEVFASLVRYRPCSSQIAGSDSFNGDYRAQDHTTKELKAWLIELS
jgi:hypothetical protein